MKYAVQAALAVLALRGGVMFYKGWDASDELAMVTGVAIIVVVGWWWNMLLTGRAPSDT